MNWWITVVRITFKNFFLWLNYPSWDMVGDLFILHSLLSLSTVMSSIGVRRSARIRDPSYHPRTTWSLPVMVRLSLISNDAWLLWLYLLIFFFTQATASSSRDQHVMRDDEWMLMLETTESFLNIVQVWFLPPFLWKTCSFMLWNFFTSYRSWCYCRCWLPVSYGQWT